MRAVVYERPGQFEVVAVPDPRPGPDEVVVEIALAGVCGTDLHLHKGEFGPSYPLTPGHEFVGTVIETGSEVRTLSKGQRVCADNTTACGRCDNCRRALPAFCRALIAQGVNAQGGLAERIVVREDKCFAVDDLGEDVAVFAEPAACAIHGLDILRPEPASDILIFGAGPTGLLLTQLLARNGAGRLTVAAPTRFKLDLARARGADETALIDRSDARGSVAGLRRQAPDGFDIVIDATGAVSVLNQCIPLTRTGGTIMVYGVPDEADVWKVPPYEVFRRELTIKGSFAQCHSFDRAVDQLRQGHLDVSGFITHRFRLDDYAAALRAITSSECLKAVVQP